jgi:hypothetical protein
MNTRKFVPAESSSVDDEKLNSPGSMRSYFVSERAQLPKESQRNPVNMKVHLGGIVLCLEL